MGEDVEECVVVAVAVADTDARNMMPAKLRAKDLRPRHRE